MINKSMCNRPSVIHRILCAFLYMGIAPVAYLFRYHQKTDFTNHHTRHALSSAFAMHAALLIFIILRIPVIKLRILREDISLAIRADAIHSILMIITFALLLLWTALSVFCALVGKSARIPILSRLSKKAWLPGTMLVIFTLGLALLVTIMCFSCHSLSITPQSNNEAKVFMLYDDGGFFPRWLFTLGFLSVTKKASNLLGPNSMCVCQLTNDTFQHAFSHGKFIVLATHGAGPGQIYAGRQIYKATDALKASDGNHPSFIYLTGCSVSKGDNSWAEAFPTTEVISFRRWSATVEHIWWLYSEAPDKLESLCP